MASAAAPTTASSVAKEAVRDFKILISAPRKYAIKKHRSLHEFCHRLPGFGVGYHFTHDKYLPDAPAAAIPSSSDSATTPSQSQQIQQRASAPGEPQIIGPAFDGLHKIFYPQHATFWTVTRYRPRDPRVRVFHSYFLCCVRYCVVFSEMIIRVLNKPKPLAKTVERFVARQGVGQTHRQRCAKRTRRTHPHPCSTRLASRYHFRHSSSYWSRQKYCSPSILYLSISALYLYLITLYLINLSLFLSLYLYCYISILMLSYISSITS